MDAASLSKFKVALIQFKPIVSYTAFTMLACERCSFHRSALAVTDMFSHSNQKQTFKQQSPTFERPQHKARSLQCSQNSTSYHGFQTTHDTKFVLRTPTSTYQNTKLSLGSSTSI